MNIECETQLVVDPEAAKSIAVDDESVMVEMEFDEASDLDVEISPDGEWADWLFGGDGFQLRFHMAAEHSRRLLDELRNVAAGGDAE